MGTKYISVNVVMEMEDGFEDEHVIRSTAELSEFIHDRLAMIEGIGVRQLWPVEIVVCDDDSVEEELNGYLPQMELPEAQLFSAQRQAVLE